jgi:hypothetical protein
MVCVNYHIIFFELKTKKLEDINGHWQVNFNTMRIHQTVETLSLKEKNIAIEPKIQVPGKEA